MPSFPHFQALFPPISKKVESGWCGGGANNVDGASEVGGAALQPLLSWLACEECRICFLPLYPSFLLCLVYRDGVIVAK